MKKLILQNESYKVFVKSFREWLDVLGYADSTVYNLPNHLQEFFYWLEQNEIQNLTDIQTKTIKHYYRALQERPNQRRAGTISKNTLNKHQQALKLFREYLKKHDYHKLNIHLKSESHPTEEKLNILTQSEIKQLFKATAYSHEKASLRFRDKAILSIFYSCGLRRNEAVHLDLNDIFFDKERIYVRKGKNYKERFVPINQKNAQILADYIYDARPEFNTKKNTEALFLNNRGSRLQGMSFANRLKAIIQATGNKDLQEKNITLHILRHSIATHLLQNEVPLESIKTFLGHTSLESTQIYTHLLKTVK